MIDELTLVRATRPPVEPLDGDERAELLAALGARGEAPAATAGAATAAVDIDVSEAAGRRLPRRAARILVAAAAPVVVLIAVLAATTQTRGGPDEQPPAITAADELRSIADHLAVAPAPVYPYSVRTLRSGGSKGKAPTPQVRHRVDARITIIEAPACAGPQPDCASDSGGAADPELVAARTPEEVRAGVRARVEAVVNRDDPPTRQPSSAPRLTADDVSVTFAVIRNGLESDQLSSFVKAELLRMLADVGHVSSQRDVVNSFGLVGTRFTLVTPDAVNAIYFVVDPADGYVLASGMEPVDGIEDLHAMKFSSGTELDRPVAEPVLAPEVQSFAASVASHGAALEATYAALGADPMCVSGFPSADQQGLVRPSGFLYLYCL